MAIERIVVVGGGTAGWMAAATLSRIRAGREVAITLVESEAIGTVGVGEATIPPFVNFNKLLELEEPELLAATQGTFKLGIQLSNWGKLGDKYIHPFGGHGYEIAGVPFHHIWHRLRESGDRRPLQVFNLETLAAYFGKFMRTPDYARDDLPPINYAYHLDASRYAAFLRRYAEARGAVRREGRVADVVLDGESGFVTTLKLEDGSEISGDLFIDCSGFRGLLIEQALETGYEDWSHWLPCNRAVALPCNRDDGSEPHPFTKATAHTAGWQWQVPLQHRNGNGHVYCSDFISDDEAHATLVANMVGKPTADPNFLRFVSGRRKKFWNRNVVALGLAAGFMEPLESTSIHLVQTGISKLISILSLDGISQVQEDAFNRLTTAEYARIRDFIILHYHATTRDDSEFWNHCRTMDVPDTLKEKIALFRKNGQVFREEDELFNETSWTAVMLGQGIEMGGHNAMADTLPLDRLRGEIDEIEKSIRHLVGVMPSHGAYVQKYCPAPAAA